jgi:hypothetical protein
VCGSGYPHVDLKYLPQITDEEKAPPSLRGDRPFYPRVFVHIYSAIATASARWFLRDLHHAVSMKMTRVLTDNVQYRENLVAWVSRSWGIGLPRYLETVAQTGSTVKK